jgi:intracellular sulfur oxidation DsrE/DsrF family protein
VSERRVAVFLSHADPGALRLAASCALGAASMSDRVDVYLFGPAVSALVAAAAAAAAGDTEPGDAGAQLVAARAEGVRLLACSASVVEERVPLAEAERALDAVVGWPTILEWTRGVVDRFHF